MVAKALPGAALATFALAPGAPGAAGGPGGPAPPTPSTGWELKVADAGTDYSTILCFVPQRLWNSKTFSKMLNSQAGGSQGSGTVVLNMNDPWWTTTVLAGGHPAHYLLDAEHLWQVYQNGVLRFDFLGETITEQLVQQGEQRLVTVTGPDTSQVLTWGSAMPPGFPNNIIYKTDALQDSFSEVDVSGHFVIDTGLWNASTGTGVLINPAGSAQIIGTPSGSVLGSETWDATNTLFSAQVAPIRSPDAANNILNGSQVTQMFLKDTVSNAWYVLMGLSGNAFYAQYHGPDGTFTHIIDTAVGYNNVQANNEAYSYWQISESGGFFFFWTSADGQTWKQQFSMKRSWDSTNVGIFFSAQYTGSTAEFATVTSINADVVTSSLGGATYLDQPQMSVWLQTLAAAQARGTVPWVTTSMSTTADSFGNPWTDSASVQVQNGTTLYALLQGQAAVLNADWIMDPGFQLRVGLPSPTSPNSTAVTLGFDRSATVRFYEGGTISARQRQRARNQIVNLLAAINTDGLTVTAQDATSITEWKQREAWIQTAAQVTALDVAVVADAAVLASADEVLSHTLQIVPNQPHRTIFQDFNVGDWVGLERPDFSAVDAVRVVGITVSLDQDGNETHELVLVSYVQWLTQQLMYIQQKMGGGFITAAGTTAIADNANGSTQQAPTVFSEHIGALGASGSTGGSPMVYNALTGLWVPAGSTDPVSGQVVQLTIPGQAAVSTVSGSGVTVSSVASPGPLNANFSFPGGSAAGWGAQHGTLAVQAATAGPGQGQAYAAFQGKLTPSQAGAGAWLTSQAGAPQVATITGIVAGAQYAVTAYCFLATQTDMAIALKVDWYDAKGAVLSSPAVSAGPITASQWQQVNWGLSAPAGAVKCNIFIGPHAAVISPSANPLYVENFYIYNAAFSGVAGVVVGSTTGPTGTTTTGAGGTTVTDGTGTVRAVHGLQVDGTVTYHSFGGPAPLAPDTPAVTATMLGVNVAWDGLLGGAVPLLDFSHVEVHLSAVNGFTPSSATLQHTFAAAGNYTVTQLAAGTVYYAVLVAVNDSGTASPASVQASTSPSTVSQNIPSGSISQGQLSFTVSGITVTFSASQPAGPHTGDLWYNTSQGNQLSQWSGSAWVLEQFGTNAITAGSVTTGLLAASAVTSAKIAAGTILAQNLAVGQFINQNSYFAGGDTTGWTGHGGTLTGTVSPPAGAPWPAAGKLSTDGATSGPAIQGTASPFPVLVGSFYLATAWVYTAQTTVTIGFTWLNSVGGTVSSSLQSTTVTANTWTQVTAIFQAPASSVTAYIDTGLTGTPTNGTLLYAQEIRLFSPFNGGIIQAGSIATAQLAAGSVTTAQLAAGSVTANALSANSVTSAKIAAGTITAADLAVGGTYNSNVYFAGGDTTGFTAVNGTLGSTLSPPAGGPYAVAATLTTTSGANPNINGNNGNVFAVQPGAFYMTQVWVYSASTSIDLGLVFLDSNKASLGNFFTTYTVTANTWTQIEDVEQAPQATGSTNAAAYAYLYVGIDGTPTGGTVLYVEEANVVSPFNGGVIEAGSVNATQLAAGSVTAGTVAAGAIDGMTITAADINASTLTGGQVILEGLNDGIFCYDSAPTQIVKVFNPSGSGSWVAVSNITTLDGVYVIGAGGGGGPSGTGTKGGGGAGGGGIGIKAGYAVTSGNTYFYHVGAGGAHNTGGTGEDSWWNSSNTETGGVIGAGGANVTGQLGGTGGNGSGGSSAFRGGTGGNGSLYGGGGGGGGGAGAGGNGGGGAAGYKAKGGGGGAGGPAHSGLLTSSGGRGGRGSEPTFTADLGGVPGGGGGGAGHGGTGNDGARGRVIIAYTPSVGTLTAALTGAAGVDPVGGTSVIGGGNFEAVLLYGAVTPATPPSNTSILYTDGNGSPTYKTSSGYNAQLSSSQCNIQGFTANSGAATAVTAAFTIGANDANLGTCYRITAFGVGTYSSGNDTWIECKVFGAGQAQAAYTSLPGTFLWHAESTVAIVTTGVSGTALVNTVFKVSAASAQANPSLIIGGTGGTGGTTVTVDTTSSTTISLISAGNGTFSIKGLSSVFERLGA